MKLKQQDREIRVTPGTSAALRKIENSLASGSEQQLQYVLERVYLQWVLRFPEIDSSHQVIKSLQIISPNTTVYFLLFLQGENTELNE